MQALLILASALLATAAVARTAEPVWQISERVDVGQVPSGFPVGFSLLTHGKRQYVAYYDADRRMTIATRTTDKRDWQRHTLDSKVGWDSHNSITMTVDSDDHLHVSGNMQIYVARFDHGKWTRRVLSDWDRPVAFSGRGAMPFIGIRISPPNGSTPKFGRWPTDTATMEAACSPSTRRRFNQSFAAEEAKAQQSACLAVSPIIFSLIP